MRLVVGDEKPAEISRLDGCYVIKTDLPQEASHPETVHDRYRDLAEVERAFRTSKTVHLEVRPVYAHKEENTRGHALVVMLAYPVTHASCRAWVDLDVTAEERLDQLETLRSMEVRTSKGGTCLRIPQPRATFRALLAASPNGCLAGEQWRPSTDESTVCGRRRHASPDRYRRSPQENEQHRAGIGCCSRSVSLHIPRFRQIFLEKN